MKYRNAFSRDSWGTPNPALRAAINATTEALVDLDDVAFADNQTPFCGDGFCDGAEGNCVGAFGDFGEVCDDGNDQNCDGCVECAFESDSDAE